MIFGRSLGQRGMIEPSNDMPLGGALRVFVAPEIGENGRFHFGASVVSH